MDPLLAAADLLLGAACAGCGSPAVDLCGPCRRRIAPRPRLVADRPVPVVAVGEHEGVLRDVMLAWKRGGHTRLGPTIGALVAASVCALEPGPAVCLVPVPTTRRGRRRRGGDLLTSAVQEASRRLEAVGLRSTVVPALTFEREPRDQVGLAARERRGNLDGALRRSRRRLTGGADVVVVDDVVTTGATLAEAVRVLVSDGVGVLGAAVVTARPAPGSTTRDVREGRGRGRGHPPFGTNSAVLWNMGPRRSTVTDM
ncbi:ComF family protein [Aeromicrobium sp. Leaf245]|uniref:ComF family protein n=1 Tax=Aeromicrobium sp. Leaf245 TaxID=1736306 RepID=UPI0006F886EB|nr:phosphoribosyltransferase family protein [Aeromicrobium sp. Leaf245]KQO41898.1 hypothetical protein ASF05_12420 [Aeromicrobium sp. Leaf245]